MRMTAQRKTTYFPELSGDAQRVADEWLDGYLQVVLRLAREHRARDDASYPQGGIDDVGGTGTIGTTSSDEDAPQ